MNRAVPLIALLATFAGIAGAQIVPPTDGYSVEVTFSGALDERLASIDRMEQRLEERFRDRRHDEPVGQAMGTRRFAAQRTAGTEWAGERLIAGVEDYTAENLVRALVAYNVNRAAPDFAGRIEVDIERLQLSEPSIAWLRSNRSHANGRVRVTAADGRVLFDGEVRSNLVVQPRVDTAYTGPELAFGETDPARRIGPTLAQFVERALERAWPERRDDIVGPVVIRLSGPGDRLIPGGGSLVQGLPR